MPGAARVRGEAHPPPPREAAAAAAQVKPGLPASLRKHVLWGRM